MGGDSCSKGCEFESRHRILDGHDIFHGSFSHVFVVFEKTKINQKEAGVGPIFLKKASRVVIRKVSS